MSKSLSSIKNEEQKRETIKRRLQSNTGGLGYFAAVDAKKKIDKPSK